MLIRQEDARDDYEKSLLNQMQAKKRDRDVALDWTARIAIQNDINALGDRLKTYRRTGEKLP